MTLLGAEERLLAGLALLLLPELELLLDPELEELLELDELPEDDEAAEEERCVPALTPEVALPTGDRLRARLLSCSIVLVSSALSCSSCSSLFRSVWYSS